MVSNAGFVATPSGSEPNPMDPAQFNGTAATYNVSSAGKVKLVKNTSTNGRAACWLVVTKNGRWAFASNTLSDSVPEHVHRQGWRVGHVGRQQRQDDAARTGRPGRPGFPSDEALSSNDHYLYVVDPFIMGGPSHIDVFKVGSNGSITHIQTTPSTLPNGVSGHGGVLVAGQMTAAAQPGLSPSDPVTERVNGRRVRQEPLTKPFQPLQTHYKSTGDIVQSRRLSGPSGDAWSRGVDAIESHAGINEGRIYVISLGHFNPGKRWSLLGLMAALAVAAVALPGTASAKSPSKSKAKAKVVGRVYSETNSPKQNQVLIFNRYSNGQLKFCKAVATGGTGGQQLQPGCAPTCPFLDTQGELVQTSDGKHVFAVNAGSNSVSSFLATPTGLKLVSVHSSGGKFPNSLTIHGGWLYVLDSGIFPMPGPPVPGNIAGLRFNAGGHLTPISGSIRALTPTVPGLARQMGFNNNGKLLVVSLLGDPTAGASGRGGLDRHVQRQRKRRGECATAA